MFTINLINPIDGVTAFNFPTLGNALPDCNMEIVHRTNNKTLILLEMLRVYASSKDSFFGAE